MKKPRQIPNDPRDYFIKTPSNKYGRPPSIRELSAVYHIKQETIMHRKKLENWPTKREQFWSKIGARTEEKEIESISDMNIRHIQEAKNLQALGFRAVIGDREKGVDPSVTIKTAGEAGGLIKTGIDIERRARGEPTEVQELEVVFTPVNVETKYEEKDRDNKKTA